MTIYLEASFPFVVPASGWSTWYSHRIEMNQKTNSRENLSPFFQCACPKIHHIDAILASSPRQFWPLSDICRFRKLTFCTYVWKSRRSKLPGGTCQDGVNMALSLFSSHRKNWFAARCECLHLIKKNSQCLFARCEFFLIRCMYSQPAANQFLRWLEKRLKDGDDEMREATCARTSTSKVPTESWTSG